MGFSWLEEIREEIRGHDWTRYLSPPNAAIDRLSLFFAVSTGGPQQTKNTPETPHAVVAARPVDGLRFVRARRVDGIKRVGGVRSNHYSCDYELLRAPPKALSVNFHRAAISAAIWKVSLRCKTRCKTR
jgi:hypothetical protein